MASILDNAAVRQAALPISVEQYHRLGEAGIISKDTELLHGVILEKMVKSPEHSWLVQRLVDWLRDSLSEGWYVRQEQPLTIQDSEPEPDIAVVRGEPENFRRLHPQSAALVIEVAITSEAIDREKALVYAVGGVSEYWLVLPHLRAIEVNSRPQLGGYAERTIARVSDLLRPAVAPAAELVLADFFEA